MTGVLVDDDQRVGRDQRAAGGAVTRSIASSAASGESRRVPTASLPVLGAIPSPSPPRPTGRRHSERWRRAVRFAGATVAGGGHGHIRPQTAAYVTDEAGDLLRRGHRDLDHPDGPVDRHPARAPDVAGGSGHHRDRKSTRLNSSHSSISYAVFCLKKKN